ncbi:MAG: hypothetical protein JXQ90_18260 [Cyclobacteriaceae bacterium]
MKNLVKYALIAVFSIAIFTGCSTDDVDELTVDVPTFETPSNNNQPGGGHGGGDSGPD